MVDVDLCACQCLKLSNIFVDIVKWKNFYFEAYRAEKHK